MIHSRSASILALAAALALAPAFARAQTGPFVGFGAGVGRIAQPSTGASRVAPSMHARAGWSITPTVAVMLEGTYNGVFSGTGDPIDGASLTDSFPTSNRKLQTGAILASVQFGSANTLYVRPGVGLAAHAFTTWHPLANDGYEERTRYEPGLAAGIAVGRQVSVIPGVPLAVEGVAQWTGSEDSTSPRWTAGVQFVTSFQF
ncbi:MAG TPA: hypothetical protein VFS20_01870 [Longimicrobium sp.]|nr:hypothetical protein [Longimicrobium sp.]